MRSHCMNGSSSAGLSVNAQSTVVRRDSHLLPEDEPSTVDQHGNTTNTLWQPVDEFAVTSIDCRRSVYTALSNNPKQQQSFTTGKRQIERGSTIKKHNLYLHLMLY